MEFKNKCNAVFVPEDLENAIIEKALEDGKVVKNIYTVSIRDGYPSVCIAHNHYRIHSLLGRLYYGECEVIHHKDGNKLNASKCNLTPMTRAEHTREHYLVQYVPEEHKKGFGKRVADIVRRNDITLEEINKLMSNGFSIVEVAQRLNCGVNTVRRRLWMKA